jgi:tetratricopeptide (TPR) repeat protein
MPSSLVPPRIGEIAPRGPCVTRLERFLKARGIKPAHLAQEAGYSRQHLLRIRRGLMEPTRRCIAAIVAAASRLSRSTVKPEELFVLSAAEGLDEQEEARSARAAAEQQRRQEAAQLLVARLERDKVPLTKWLAEIDASGGASAAIAAALYERGRELTFEDARRAEQVHRIAIAIAERLPRDLAATVSIHGRAHMGRGNALANLGNYPAAFVAFDEAEHVLTASPSCVRELAQVWYSRARTHVRQTGYVAATRWIRRARVIFDATSEVRMSALSRVLEGAILYETGNPASAEQLLRTTLDPLERMKDRAGLAFAWLDLGRCNIDLGDVTAARQWLEKARKGFSRLRMRSEVVRAQWCLG